MTRLWGPVRKQKKTSQLQNLLTLAVVPTQDNKCTSRTYSLPLPIHFSLICSLFFQKKRLCGKEASIQSLTKISFPDLRGSLWGPPGRGTLCTCLLTSVCVSVDQLPPIALVTVRLQNSKRQLMWAFLRQTHVHLF